MNLFSRGQAPDINTGVREFQQHPGSMLVDARTPQEYAQGHIAGSINIPVQVIGQAAGKLGGKDRPIYVYCQSGARSQQAVSILHQLGFVDAVNIGGIQNWKGPVERG